jgi:hypothetical protein
MNRRAEANRRYAIGTGLIIGGLVALSLAVFLFRPAQLDPTTLCPLDKPIEGHTVVIVDRTDKWSGAMGDALRGIVEDAQRSTLQYQKFSIVALDAENSTHPLFSVCNPGAPTFWSDLYRGHRYTVRDFNQKFVGAADSIIDEVSAPAEAPTSPIVEYVHRWLGGDDFNASIRNRRLILISDMRQNTPLYSLYRHPNGAGFEDVVKQQFGQASNGVAFDVYFIAHGQDRDVPEALARAAWDRAFTAMGAHYTWRQID